VPKSFARLETYSLWLEENGQWARLSEPLNQAEMAANYEKAGFFCGVLPSPKSQLVLWFMQLKLLANAQFDAVSLVRMVLWVMHQLAFDADVQRHGVVVIQDQHNLRWGDIDYVLPDVARQRLKTLSQGASAVKMKHYVLVRTPWWADAIITIMKLFMSAKMAQRIKLIGDDWKALHTLLPAAVLPVHFGNGEGKSLETDRFFDFAYLVPEPEDNLSSEGARHSL